MVKKNTLIRNISLVACVLALMILIVFLIGKTFGFFQYVKKGETTNVISISGIDVRVINNTDNNLNLAAYPMYDSEGLTQDSFDISINNTSKRPIDYTLKVLNDEDKQDLTKLLSTEYIRFSYELNNGTWSEPKTLGGANNDIIYSETVNGKETRNISIKLWVSSEAPNSVQGKEFYGKLILTGEKSNKVSVTFNSNGGNTIDNKFVLQGNSIGELPTPVKNNYYFEGWYLDSNFTTKVDSTYVPTSDITLYAKWDELITYVDILSNQLSATTEYLSYNYNSNKLNISYNTSDASKNGCRMIFSDKITYNGFINISGSITVDTTSEINKSTISIGLGSSARGTDKGMIKLADYIDNGNTVTFDQKIEISENTYLTLLIGRSDSNYSGKLTGTVEITDFDINNH